jgi:hypothetical protein
MGWSAIEKKWYWLHLGLGPMNIQLRNWLQYWFQVRELERNFIELFYMTSFSPLF